MPSSKNKYKADIVISGRTNEHKANAFTLIQAPGMQDLIIKCSLAALHLYKSDITLKRRPVPYLHLIDGETKPLEVERLSQNQTWVCLYWIRPISSRQKCYLYHQAQHRKVQENPHYRC